MWFTTPSPRAAPGLHTLPKATEAGFSLRRQSGKSNSQCPSPQPGTVSNSERYTNTQIHMTFHTAGLLKIKLGASLENHVILILNPLKLIYIPNNLSPNHHLPHISLQSLKGLSKQQCPYKKLARIGS